jgi:hypothetical protein
MSMLACCSHVKRSRRFTDEPVAKIVQCGEPIFSCERGVRYDCFHEMPIRADCRCIRIVNLRVRLTRAFVNARSVSSPNFFL